MPGSGAAGGKRLAGQNASGRRSGRERQEALARRPQRVGVLVLGVVPELLPPITKPEVPEPVEADPAEPLPLVPLPPIELVLPVVLPLVAVSLPVAPLVEPPVLPAVLPVPGPELDGVVVLLLDELEPGVPAASRLLHALSESPATTASVTTATCVRDVFIGKLLWGLFEIRAGH